MSQELLQKIACELNKRYKERYLTKLDFSYAANVDEKTIRRILQGRQNISIILLKKVCEAVDLSLSDLFQLIENRDN
jgi:DNA-binding XRE family transcriptional regulator